MDREILKQVCAVPSIATHHQWVISFHEPKSCMVTSYNTPFPYTIRLWIPITSPKIDWGTTAHIGLTRGTTTSAEESRQVCLQTAGRSIMAITLQHTYVANNLVPRPLFSVFICGGGKKGLVDLRRTFCSTDSQILGVVNRCWQLQRPFWRNDCHLYLRHQIAN